MPRSTTERWGGRVRLGLFLQPLEGWLGEPGLPGWAELRALAREAEAMGFDCLFVPDHLLIRGSPYWGIPAGETRGTWEAWTLLAALAEATSRIGLAPFVAAAAFRHPAVLAKMAATLAEVSGGRLILGLGSGSHLPEHPAFGLPDDHLVSRFEEALQIVVPLLRDGRVDFQGRYYTARDCELRPPARPGGVPIWIAAFRPRMLGLTARWGDGLVTAWHARPEALREPFGILDAACRAAGRDPRALARVVGTIVSFRAETRFTREVLRGTTEELAAALDAFRATGVDHLVCMLDPRDARGLERFAPVVAAWRRTPG
jgi:alkanesulfonate monooxygenase SsuD/methylene tetrahydromethanopterin reductase-like flavin-dependent oxidoreductase (luciferase family)